MTQEQQPFETLGHADGVPRDSLPPAQADWAGVAPELRQELEAKLQPGERVLWVQQAQPDIGRILLTEKHYVWVIVIGLIILTAVAWPVESIPREGGGTVLRMGGTPAFLLQNGDITALRTGAIAGCVAFSAGVSALVWQVFKLSRLRKEVYAITNRRFLYLHPFLLDLAVDEAPIRNVTLHNRVAEGGHRADVFISYPRTVTTDFNARAQNAEVMEFVRMRGILDPAGLEKFLPQAVEERER